MKHIQTTSSVERTCEMCGTTTYACEMFGSLNYAVCSKCTQKLSDQFLETHFAQCEVTATRAPSGFYNLVCKCLHTQRFHGEESMQCLIDNCDCYHFEENR